MPIKVSKIESVFFNIFSLIMFNYTVTKTNNLEKYTYLNQTKNKTACSPQYILTIYYFQKQFLFNFVNW